MFTASLEVGRDRLDPFLRRAFRGSCHQCVRQRLLGGTVERLLGARKMGMDSMAGATSPRNRSIPNSMTHSHGLFFGVPIFRDSIGGMGHAFQDPKPFLHAMACYGLPHCEFHKPHLCDSSGWHGFIPAPKNHRINVPMSHFSHFLTNLLMNIAGYMFHMAEVQWIRSCLVTFLGPYHPSEQGDLVETQLLTQIPWVEDKSNQPLMS